MAEGWDEEEEVLTDNRRSPCYLSVLTCGIQNNYYKFYKDKKGKLDNNSLYRGFSVYIRHITNRENI